MRGLKKYLSVLLLMLLICVYMACNTGYAALTAAGGSPAAASPLSKPASTPITMPDGISFAGGFRRGINLGDMMEAPNEGDWGPQFKDEYIPVIKGMGFDFIRLPISWSTHTEGGNHTKNADFFRRIDHIINLAVGNGLGMIINIHHFNELDADPAAHGEKLYSIWRQVSARYADLPPNIVFEINNEPHGAITAPVWNELQNNCIAIIRKTNPTRKILVTAADWGGPDGVADLVLPNDENLLVSFHGYEPFTFTHQGADWSPDDMDQYLGAQWHGTEAELSLMEQTFKRMKSWSEASGIPVLLGEFGAYGKADMASRVRWTAAMRTFAEEYGFVWAYWEFCAGFGVFNPETNQVRRELLDALTGAPVSAAYGTKRSDTKIKLAGSGGMIGPAVREGFTFECGAWTGITWDYTANGGALIKLYGSGFTVDWASAYIPLLQVTDAGGKFSHGTAALTFRNADNSITDLCVNLDNGMAAEAELLWPDKGVLLGGGADVIKNADGTTTFILNLNKAYDELKGHCPDGVRLKLFIESVPDRRGSYDRAGELEIMRCEGI